MNKFIFCVICLCVLNACKNHPKEDIQTSKETIVIEGEIHQIPDPSFVTEDIDVSLLQKTIVQNVRVVDNHMQVGLTRKEFIELGLPEDYYDRLLKSLDEVNHMIDSTGLENMDQILKDSYQDLYELFGYPESKE